MSFQSVTIRPSQLSSSLTHPVSNSRSAWNGIPPLLAELTISDSAPARMHSIKGAKHFSLNTLRVTEEGVR